MEEGTRQRLIEIQNYIGNAQYSCRYCGSVNEWKDTVIEQVNFKNNTLHYKPICNDCRTAGSWLLQSKTERIFWKGNSHDVDSFETNLLQWMLKVNYFGIRPKRIKEAVMRILESRVFAPVEVKDIQIDREAVKRLERIHEVESEIEEREKKVSELRQKIIDESSIMTYFEVDAFSKQIMTLNSRIIKGRKLLSELLKEQKDDE